MKETNANLKFLTFNLKLPFFLSLFFTLITHTVFAASVDLPRTGQTTSYATGDDRDTKAGVSWPSPRFSDNGDGTITDNLTGLIWLTDANCFGSKTWSTAVSDANSLANGSCSLSDGSSVGDWRLPNVNELESLVNAEESNIATWLNTQGFTQCSVSLLLVRYYLCLLYGQCVVRQYGRWRRDQGTYLDI